MDRITRKDLKSDKFALEVGQGVDFVGEHKDKFIRWGSIALGVVILFFAISWYRSYKHGERQQALADAFVIQNATVGPPQGETGLTFPSQGEKDQAVNKAFTEIAAKFPGTDEGQIAEFYLGAQAADKGDLAQAAKRFRLVVDGGPKDYASLAKLSLAQVEQSQGKLPEAEKLVRSVMDHPTVLVSKEEATISLARLVAVSNPNEARKLLEPLRANQRSAVSRAALTALSDLPKQ